MTSTLRSYPITLNARDHKIDRYKDFLKRNGDARIFGLATDQGLVPVLPSFFIRVVWF
jgi:hypothetical protein